MTLPAVRLFCPDQPAEVTTRKRKRLPHFLRWPDAMKLLDWCVAEIDRQQGARKAAAVRDEIVIRVGLYLGLRVSEIKRVNVEDVDLANRTAIVREGKGGRDRSVRIPQKILPHIEKLIGARKDGMLIEGRKGRRVAIRTVCWRIGRAARLAGVPVHVHPHILRHTYATHFLQTGGNLRNLQALLGHSDLSTTAVYLDLDTERFAQEVDRM